MSETNKTECPVCHSEFVDYRRQEPNEVITCGKCGTVTVHPLYFGGQLQKSLHPKGGTN